MCDVCDVCDVSCSVGTTSLVSDDHASAVDNNSPRHRTQSDEDEYCMYHQRFEWLLKMSRLMHTM